MMIKMDFEKIDNYQWKVPKEGEMRVPGIFFGSKEIVEDVSKDEKVIEQIKNVAKLPGIQKAAMAMPDAHRGYGFPIGGVAAFDSEQGGIISAGAVGYDISCGVRALKTGLKKDIVRENIEELAETLYNMVPAGLGSKGEIKLNISQMDEVLIKGAEWAVEKGYGTKEDLEYIEENGRMENTDPKTVSKKAKERQKKEMGTLGSGNHYLELQKVTKIHDKGKAKILGIEKNDVMIMIHCGSRALGHQVATEYTEKMKQSSRKHNIKLPDRELAAAPINSDTGQKYIKAMNSAINLAAANRQVITGLTRRAFDQVLPEAKLKTMYEINHNTCKKEEHMLNGEKKELYVHRKGATRSFGPESKILPKKYMKIGQPVLIGGTMGTASYILTGTKKAMEKSFGSTCHGAGRKMSRTKAKKEYWGQDVVKRLKNNKNIIIKAHSMSGAAEEAPGAYKDINKVAESVEKAGISRRVAKVEPMAVIKG